MYMEDGRRNRRVGQLILAVAGGILLLGAVRYTGSSISISSNVNGRELPIRSVETEEAKVSLTFDVAWNSEDLDMLLEILEKEDVRASFFVTGEWVGKHPEQVKAIYEGGHDLGNHTQSHENMTMLSEEDRRTQIARVQEQVCSLTETKMNLFRPPYGNYDDSLILLAKELGYETVTWDIDSEDWKDYGKEAILRTVLQSKELKNGSIILLHAGTRYLEKALPELIQGLLERGYVPVPLSELLIRGDYCLDVTGRQRAVPQ